MLPLLQKLLGDFAVLAGAYPCKARLFLDGLSAASISIIAVVGLHLFTSSVQQWHGATILALCLASTLICKKLNTVVITGIGSLGGF